MTLVESYQLFIKNNIKKSFHYQGDVMNYRLFGEGKQLIVLFLGTSMFSSDAYFKLQEELSKQFQVLSIEDLAMKVSIEKINDMLSQLIKLLGFKKVILLGMSHGGGIAQAFARDHASQTENLILYNTISKPKLQDEYNVQLIEGILATIDQLKELRKMMPLNKIKEALLDQIKEATDDEDAQDLFAMLIAKYTDSDEKQQMEIIKDLLKNYAFDRTDFKYLNYKSLIFYSFDQDPLGGMEFIETLVDMMTNPSLKFIESDRFRLIINPKPMVESIFEYLIKVKQKSAL